MRDGIYDSICQVVGRTPVVCLNRIPKDGWSEMPVKLKSFNSGESVKGRIGLRMIEAAEQQGCLKTGGKSGPYRTQGIGAGFIPPVFNRNVFDRILTDQYEEARAVARRLAELEGIFCRVSSGAILHAASTASQEPGRGTHTLAILPDAGERYLSTELFS